MYKSTIGILKENSLHAEIKNWYRQANDILEDKLDGYLVDIVRGDLLIEIQISHFYSLREKLAKLLPDHTIRLVYPIPVCKWISRYDINGNVLIRRRKSPKQNQIHSLFEELIYLPTQFMHPNFSLEVLLIEQEDIWFNDGMGSWRRQHWSIADRKLWAVYGRTVFFEPKDFSALLPDDLPKLFTSQDIANRTGFPRSLVRKMLYCLYKMNQVEIVGTKKRFRLYSVVSPCA
jgi:hypothetical protein